MAGAQVPSSVTILNSLKGFQGISLTEFDTSALSAIAAGSVVEIAGAFFNFPADETINASTWTSMASGNTAYIVLVPAGVAGSQTVTAEFTATAPVWRDDNQGWYASAASVSRVIGSVYKINATSQTQKNYYPSQTNSNNGDMYIHSASVASSLTVGGAASLAGTLSVMTTISSYGIKPYNSLHGTSVTYNDIFDAISPSIPVTGDTILVSGMIGTVTLSKVSRASASTITVYGSTGVALNSTDITNGSGTTATNISLAW
jgi:hypothetical protein